MIAKGQQNEPEPPENNGGFGGGTDYPLGHKNELAKLEGRALKWNVKPEYREAILNRQVKTAIDPASSPRDSARAARFVLDCDKYEADRERPAKGTTFYVQNNSGEVKIIEDANWYGNSDRLPPETS